MSLDKLVLRLKCLIMGKGRHNYKLVVGSDFEYLCSRCRRPWINQVGLYSLEGSAVYYGSQRYRDLKERPEQFELAA